MDGARPTARHSAAPARSPHGALLGVVMGALLSHVLSHAAMRAQLAALAQRGEEERARALPGLWLTTRILRWALLEGALLLDAVLYLVAGHPLSLLLALALLVLLLMRAPRRGEQEAWLAAVTPPEDRGGPPARAPR